MRYAHSLAGGDLEDLGGKADGALDTELLVLGTVDQVSRDYTVISTNTYYKHICTYTSPSS